MRCQALIPMRHQTLRRMILALITVMRVERVLPYAARLTRSPELLASISGVWRPRIAVLRGFDGAAVTGWYVGVDTDVHHGRLGTSRSPAGGRQLHGTPQCGPTQDSGQVTRDTTQRSNGWHRLLRKTGHADPQISAAHAAVLSIFFLVQH